MERHGQRAVICVWMIGLIVALGACGDPNDPVNQAAPAANDALVGVAPTTSGPEVIATAAAVEVTVEVIEGRPFETAVPSAEPAPTVGPLGGVTIDDPFPTQADWVSDPAVAETAVRYAYQHWILIDFDKDLRARLIENGEDNADGLDEGLKAARSIAEFARFAVDEVRFIDAEHADVSFRIQWNDGPSPYFPNPMSGSAIYQNGSWRVGGPTLCVLALGSGVSCAGNGAPRLAPAVALQLVGVPAGFEWIGDPAQRDIVAVPGGGSWSKTITVIAADGTEQLQANEIWMSTEILIGASQMAPESMALVLASGRFGLPTGTPEMLGDQPVRISVDETGAEMVFVRGDDVVVRLRGDGMTGPQLRALAGSIATLTELPAGTVGDEMAAVTVAPAFEG